MGKKSNAQINRMKRRAAARGEEYTEPPEWIERKKKTRMLAAAVKLHEDLERINKDDTLKAKERRSAKRKAEAIASEEAGCSLEELKNWFDERNGDGRKKNPKSANDKSLSGRENEKLAAAEQLQNELSSIEGNKSLNTADRNSAKEKAEAIAVEQTGCRVAELLEWYSHYKKDSDAGTSNEKTDETAKTGAENKSFHNPYIVFVGQLSYATTRDGLFRYFQKELGKEHSVTNDTLRVRLLTDAKTKKSRGMAFVETTDPELLYACLRLHHTELDGRRINVERSAGGKRNSAARKSKIDQYREEQKQHMSESVDKMLQEYRDSGDLDQSELDEGVVALCKRHSAATVEAALEEYVAARGRDMDNPSAYLTFIIGRIASDGVNDQTEDKRKGRSGGGNRYEKRKSSDEHSKKRHRTDGQDSSHGMIGNKLQKQSEFSKAGMDMSISSTSQTDKGELSTIFPSIGRGRGSCRGYM